MVEKMLKKILKKICVLILFSFLFVNNLGAENLIPIYKPENLKPENLSKLYEAEILAIKKHQAEIFTQGLFFKNGFLYESSGLYNKSFLLKWAFAENLEKPAYKVLKHLILPENIFAEGITWANSKIYLLTWQENQLLVLDDSSFEILEKHSYNGEGWGLIYDGENFWRSDGTAQLTKHAPENFKEIKKITVTDGQHKFLFLNELEYDKERKLILANVYGSNYVAIIAAETGLVKAWLNASILAEKEGLLSNENFVLNGLALAEDNKSLWLRGKYWEHIYQIKWPPKDF